MNVSFTCAECQTLVCVDVSPDDKSLCCPDCQRRWVIPPEAFGSSDNDSSPDIKTGPAEQLQQCLACPCVDLFVRKDFPQRLGVLIVVVGLGMSCIFYSFHMLIWTFGALFATALVDLVLYSIVGNVLECYRCQAQYRDVEGLDSFSPFELETFERHRQMAARFADAGATQQGQAQQEPAGELSTTAKAVPNAGKAP